MCKYTYFFLHIVAFFLKKHQPSPKRLYPYHLIPVLSFPFPLYHSLKSPLCILSPPNNCPSFNLRHAFKVNSLTLISQPMHSLCGHSVFSTLMLCCYVFFNILHVPLYGYHKAYLLV